MRDSNESIAVTRGHLDDAVSVTTQASKRVATPAGRLTYREEIRMATRGTAYLVLVLASRDTLSVDEARAVIDGMIDEGWYCAPNGYAALVRKLESMTE